LPRTRIARNIEREVTYSDEHWRVLAAKRRKGVYILKFLSRYGFKPFIFGSVARGDIHKKSDIEIIVLDSKALPYIELLLLSNFGLEEKTIIMATPRTAIKVYFHIDPELTVVVPAVPLSYDEYEFYKFGGKIELPEAENPRNRVPGVNKNLCLILPTERGHMEFSIIGREHEVSRILGVRISIVNERKHMLLRRDQLGRTGVYLELHLDPNESTMRKLMELRDTDPAIRRLYREREAN